MPLVCTLKHETRRKYGHTRTHRDKVLFQSPQLTNATLNDSRRTVKAALHDIRHVQLSRSVTHTLKTKHTVNIFVIMNFKFYAYRMCCDRDDSCINSSRTLMETTATALSIQNRV